MIYTNKCNNKDTVVSTKRIKAIIIVSNVILTENEESAERLIVEER